MCKILTLIIAGLLVVETTNAQEYISFRNYLNEGTYWFYENQYDSAVVYYQQAEQFNLTFFPTEAHLYSRALWETNQKEKSIAVLLQGGRSDFFKKDTTFYLGLSNSEREKILLQLPEMNNEITQERAVLFETLKRWDQIYRIRLSVSPRDSIAIYNRKMNYQDSVNLLILIKEIQTNGYPDGYTFAGTGLGAVLLHSKPNWLMANYKVFMNEIENGRMNLFDFAMAIDRCTSTPENPNHKPYNLYFSLDATQVDSPELVFINRCLIGMSPYYNTHQPMVLRRGVTPQKSKLYEYYKQRKKSFNCIKIK